jgi:hypothetical protein
MTTIATFCVVCQQDTIPLEETGLCGWCMCNPVTGEPDRVAHQRERSRINCQRSRARKRDRLESKLSPNNDRSAGLNPPQVKHPALQEARA